MIKLIYESNNYNTETVIFDITLFMNPDATYDSSSFHYDLIDKGVDKKYNNMKYSKIGYHYGSNGADKSVLELNARLYIDISNTDINEVITYINNVVAEICNEVATVRDYEITYEIINTDTDMLNNSVKTIKATLDDIMDTEFYHMYYTEIFEENEPGTCILQITDGKYLIYRCFITINNNRYIFNNKSFTSIDDLCNEIYTLAYPKLCDDADIKAEKEQEFYNR